MKKGCGFILFTNTVSYLSKFGGFLRQISVVVIADDDPVSLRSQLQYVTVVIANHPFPSDKPGWRKYQHALALQFCQYFLVPDWVVGSRCLLPPLGHKDRYILVSTRLEPIDAQLDA